MFWFFLNLLSFTTNSTVCLSRQIWVILYQWSVFIIIFSFFFFSFFPSLSRLTPRLFFFSVPSSPFQIWVASISPSALIHHFINGPTRKYSDIKSQCAHGSTHSCCEVRLRSQTTRTVMRRTGDSDVSVLIGFVGDHRWRRWNPEGSSPPLTPVGKWSLHVTIASPSQTGYQIQIVLRRLKALSLLRFSRTCLTASFKLDRLCLLISQWQWLAVFFYVDLVL